MQQKVRQERTGWRDQKISQRHKQWGWDCPATDIDFLMMEYDNSKVVALVEYKNEHYTQKFLGTPTCNALIDLADRAGVPAFFTVYSSDFSTWTVTPLNGIAREFTPNSSWMFEFEWVSLLYRIRGREMPRELWKEMDWE